MFETIIFFAALGGEGNGAALVGGIAVGVAGLLALIAWAMLRFSARLPIAKFFAYSAALIAVLAVVLAGKGVAALQEAGMIGVTPLAGFRAARCSASIRRSKACSRRALMIALLAAGFLYTNRRPAAA